MNVRWTVGSKIAAGFGAALVVFLAVGVVSYVSTARLVEASEIRRQTYDTADALADARFALRGIGIALRTYLLTGTDADLQALGAAQRAIEAPMQTLRARVVNEPAQLQRLDALGVLLKDYIAATHTMAQVRLTQGQAEATRLLQAEGTRQTLSTLGNAINELNTQQDTVLAERTAQAAEAARYAGPTVALGNAVALALALLAGWLIARNIGVPLQALTSVAERITAGDLGAPVLVGDRSDEIGALGRAIARMTASLQSVAQTANRIASGDLRAPVQPQSDADTLGHALARMTTDLRAQFGSLVEGISVLGSAAGEIVASSSQLAATATQSAAAVSETTTTVEEVRHTAQLASQKARLVSDTAQRAVQVADNGRRSTQDVEQGMARIRSQMDSIAAGMMQLSERTQAVGQVIAAVEDLATQSNMLAVNAAIEAAKAGEHGKGFSVVAQEVKSLAEQSRHATNQVRGILGDIQKASAAAVMSTEEGSKVVEAGARQAEAVGGAVQSLGGSVNEAAQAALQIAASSQQQLVGMDQVASAMDSIKQASTQNVDAAAQLEATARSIGDLGQRLKQMVERYKV